MYTILKLESPSHIDLRLLKGRYMGLGSDAGFAFHPMFATSGKLQDRY